MLEERDRCLEAGMQDHVTKPVDPEKLYAALEAALKLDAHGEVEALLGELGAAAVVGGLERLEAPVRVAAQLAEADGEVDRERVAPVLRELAALLRANDFAAEQCFAQLEDALAASHTDEMEQVRAMIDSLEYSAALEPLAVIAATLDIDLKTLS